MRADYARKLRAAWNHLNENFSSRPRSWTTRGVSQRSNRELQPQNASRWPQKVQLWIRSDLNWREERWANHYRARGRHKNPPKWFIASDTKLQIQSKNWRASRAKKREEKLERLRISFKLILFAKEVSAMAEWSDKCARLPRLFH